MIIPVSVSLFVISFLIVVVLFVRSRLMLQFLSSDLTDWIDFAVDIDGYFMSKFRSYCNSIAFKTTLFDHRSDKKIYGQKFYDKFLPVVFTKYEHNYDNTSNIFFSLEFRNFVHDACDDCLVLDFPSVLGHYLRTRFEDMPKVDHVSQEFRDKLVTSIMDSALSDYSEQFAKEMDEQLQERKILEQKLIESVEKEKDKDVLEMSKQMFGMAYNIAVKDIKLNGNRGLNPIAPVYLSNEVRNAIVDMRVYTPQSILRSKDISDDECDFRIKGCYIVFNTFNKKYFIGRSESVYDSVYSLLKDDVFGGCVLLKNDVNVGHYVLIKFVPFEDSGYDDLITMQRDLIRAYESYGENGYNTGGSHGE